MAGVIVSAASWAMAQVASPSTVSMAGQPFTSPTISDDLIRDAATASTIGTRYGMVDREIKIDPGSVVLLPPVRPPFRPPIRSPFTP
jgi:hypothetical protein